MVTKKRRAAILVMAAAIAAAVAGGGWHWHSPHKAKGQPTAGWAWDGDIPPDESPAPSA